MEQVIKFGDITTVTSGIIIQGCNAQGVMGSGVAKAIRDKWPDNYTVYADRHKEKPLALGEVVIYKPEDRLWIANAITQIFYGRDGRKYMSYAALQMALKKVAEQASRYRLMVHYPMIGAGLGGGDWAIIQSIIDSVFDVHPAVRRFLWIQDDFVS